MFSLFSGAELTHEELLSDCVQLFNLRTMRPLDDSRLGPRQVHTPNQYGRIYCPLCEEEGEARAKSRREAEEAEAAEAAAQEAAAAEVGAWVRSVEPGDYSPRPHLQSRRGGRSEQSRRQWRQVQQQRRAFSHSHSAAHRSVGALLLHLFTHHAGVPSWTPNERRDEVIDAHLAPFVQPEAPETMSSQLLLSPCALLAAPGAADPVVAAELRRVGASAAALVGGPTAAPSPPSSANVRARQQECRGCNRTFTGPVELARHVGERNPRRFRAGLDKPGACGVSTSPGFLCTCTACELLGPGGLSAGLCTRCHHPVALHTDYVRFSPPANKKEVSAAVKSSGSGDAADTADAGAVVPLDHGAAAEC